MTPQYVTEIVAKVAGIQTSLSDLGSQYRETFRLAGGLQGSLTMMLEFVSKRVDAENPVDEATLAHLSATLTSIRDAVDDVAALEKRRVLGLPIGRAIIFLGPLCGRAGSRLLIKRLNDLAGDLQGDTEFIRLQLMANAIDALNKIAESREVSLDSVANPSVRAFWLKRFSRAPRADPGALAEALAEECGSGDAAAAAGAYLAGAVAPPTPAGLDRLVPRGKSVAEWVLTDAGALAVASPAHTAAVTCMAASGFMLFTGSLDRTLKSYAVDASGGISHRHTMVGHAGGVLCVDALENLLVSSSSDKTLIVWRVDRNSVRHRHRLAVPATCLKILDARTAVRANAEYVSPLTVFDVSSGDTLYELRGHAGGTLCVDVDRAARRMYSTGADRRVRCWDADARAEVGDLGTGAADAGAEALGGPVDQIARAGGSTVVTRGPRALALVDAATGETLALEERDARFESTVGAGRYTATLRNDGDGRAYSVLITDGQNPRGEIRTVRFVARPETRATHACFVGRTVYAAFSDGSLRWYADEGATLRERGALESRAGAAASRIAPLKRPLIAHAAGRTVVADEGGRLEFPPAPGDAPGDALAVACLAAVEDALLCAGGSDRDGRASLWVAAAAPGDGASASEGSGLRWEAVSLPPGCGRRVTHAFAVPGAGPAPGRLCAVVDEARVVAAGRGGGGAVLLERPGCAFVHPAARGALIACVTDGLVDFYDSGTFAHSHTVDYRSLGLAPATHAADAPDGLVTVHGGADVCVWPRAPAPDAAGSGKPVATLLEGVQDLAHNDRGLFVAARNGMIYPVGEPGARSVGPAAGHHRPGRVRLCGSPGGALHSVDEHGVLVSPAPP